MRVKNSIKNVSVAMVSYVLAMLIGIVSQSILVRYLGIEYNGINGLFSNIISMLSVAELGIGSAIVYHLYKPIAENNYEQIKSLMKFYKRAYRLVAMVVAIIGVILIPFLGKIVGETTIQSKEINMIFLLFLFDAVSSYLLTYKRSLLYADQKNYIINIIHIFYTVLLNIFQIYIIIATKNYILYLIVKVLFRILENIIITIITNLRYKFILEKNVEPIDNNIVKDIMQKIKALLFHKIGGYLVDGTDNIIISTFLGISSVGILTNYRIILNAVSTLISQAFNAITASVGNLLVLEEKEKVYITYKELSLMNFFIYYMSCCILYTTISSMIKIIYGGSYLMNTFALLTLIVNFYVQGMKKNIQLFKEAACIFYEDRYIPLIEAALNLIISILLVKIWGMTGVFIGSILSSLVIFMYSYPKYVYSKILDRSGKEYIFEQAKYFGLFIVTIFTLTIVQNIVRFDNNLLELFINLILTGIFTLIIFIIKYHQTNEFKYYKDFLISIINRIKRGRENDRKSKA